MSARIDGGDHLGLIVAHRATEMAIAKAESSGIAVVGANNTSYRGCFHIMPSNWRNAIL